MFGKLCTWLRREEGATAVEFALVGMPFLVMLMGIVEVNLYFATSVMLEGATNDAARMIRTGQIAAAEDPKKAFQDALCSKLVVLVDCDQLEYEVVKIPGNVFANAPAPRFDENGNLIADPDFEPGGASEAVLIRTFYRYPFLFPLIGSYMTGGQEPATGTLMSTAAVRNEPYRFGS